MTKQTQEQIIIESIDTLIDNGISDLVVIYSTIERKFHIPRPTVRRFAGKYRKICQNRFDVLNINAKNLHVKKWLKITMNNTWD